jgi:Fur family iron response transcriptional regulator
MSPLSPTVTDIKGMLRSAGMSPTAQRISIAKVVFCEGDHPSAKEVWERVSTDLSVVSQATVYNTLNSMVEKGLLRMVRTSSEGTIRFDANTMDHHHFYDVKTGKLYDIPFDEVELSNLDTMRERFDIHRISVTIEGEKVS